METASRCQPGPFVGSAQLCLWDEGVLARSANLLRNHSIPHTYANSARSARIWSPQNAPPPINTRLLLLSLALYGPLVVLIEWHQPLLGAAVVLLCYLLSFPAVVRQIDWVLLLVFILMFLDLRLVANLAIIQTGMQHIGLTVPTRLFLVGVVASQLIS